MVYRIQYASIQHDAPSEAKQREREILQKSIDLLLLADKADALPSASAEAIHYTTRVWTTFLADLASRENHLPNEMKANLISIGIWILKELDSIHSGKSKDYKSIIDLSEIIRDGL